jgi:hypothetical protein
MSRIDEALRRLTGGAAAESRSGSLKPFPIEKTVHHEEARVSQFVPGPQLPPETTSGASSKLPHAAPTLLARPEPISARQSAGAVPTAPIDEPVEAPTEPHTSGDGEPLVDLGKVANYLGFLANSVFRHKMLAGTTFLVILALTFVTVTLLPKTYHAQTKLLAQRNAVMAALSNPGRAVPWDADAPTRAATETILRRDNLILLIQETNLIAESERTRAPILKALDAVVRYLSGKEPTPEEKLDQMVDLLSKNMVVVTGPYVDGTVTIDLDWQDAEMAFKLVQKAEQAFLAARQAAETAAINESIGILENYSSTLHTDIEDTMSELQRTKASRRAEQRAIRAAASSRLQVVPPVTALLPPLSDAARGIPALSAELDDPELRLMKATIETKRQEIAKLEDARQQQIGELQTRLGQLKAVYTSSHPSVLTTQQNIDALSQPSAQISALKAAADRLEADYQARVAAADELAREEDRKAAALHPEAAPKPSGTSEVAEARTIEPPPASDDEPDFSSVRLRLKLNQAMNVLERTDAARIELAVSQKAFKYRYTVITPAQVPKAPIRPHGLRILLAGGLAGLLMAFGASAGKDLLSNRIIEPWQVERQLGLPVLGTLVNV